jgi:hypothetical protein
VPNAKQDLQSHDDALEATGLEYLVKSSVLCRSNFCHSFRLLGTSFLVLIPSCGIGYISAQDQLILAVCLVEEWLVDEEELVRPVHDKDMRLRGDAITIDNVL